MRFSPLLRPFEFQMVARCNDLGNLFVSFLDKPLDVVRSGFAVTELNQTILPADPERWRTGLGKPWRHRSDHSVHHRKQPTSISHLYMYAIANIEGVCITILEVELSITLSSIIPVIDG